MEKQFAPFPCLINKKDGYVYVNRILGMTQNPRGVKCKTHARHTNPIKKLIEWFWQNSNACFIQFALNSLTHGRCDCNFQTVIFILISGLGIFIDSREFFPVRIPQDATDDQLTLVQVMVWYQPAASHYLSQFWSWASTPYGVTRPQWVKTIVSACAATFTGWGMRQFPWRVFGVQHVTPLTHRAD